jgi:hypothetical protein
MMLKQVGASGQLSLGKKFAGRYFQVEPQEDGALMLRPMQVIPESQGWLHTREMAARLLAADAWMAAHPPRETDLARFEADIAQKRPRRSIKP